MGDSWFQIAEPVRELHATYSLTCARGRLRIEHGRHRVARLLVWLLRLPRPSDAAETQLTVTARADGELWQRSFDGRVFETRQYASNDAELAERYGVLEFRFRLDATGGSLLYIQREAALLLGVGRMVLPGRLAPHIEAREDPVGPRRVNVAVSVALPGIGLLISYHGIISIAETHA